MGYNAFIFTKNQNLCLLRPACEVDCVSKPSDDYTVTADTAVYTNHRAPDKLGDSVIYTYKWAICSSLGQVFQL